MMVDNGGQSIELNKWAISGPTELYSMGENMSYNLGHSLHSPKSLPEPIEFFRHANITIKLVWLVYLCKSLLRIF